MGKLKDILSLKAKSLKKRESRNFQKIAKNFHVNNFTQSSSAKINECSLDVRENYFDRDTFEDSLNRSDDQDSHDNFDAKTETDEAEFTVYDLGLKDFLKKWSTYYNINRNALSSLLKFLKKFDESLPTDSRTLMQTPRNTDLVEMSPGHYIHIGLKNHVQNFLKTKDNISPKLKLRINVDGLPIHKNSSEMPAVWVIQGDFGHNSCTPFVIGVYGGPTKPDNFNSFLSMTVEEIKEIKNLSHNNDSINVILHQILADAPAKSSVLCVKGHNGHSACPKCEVEGKTIERKTSFFNLNATLRTNDRFRLKLNEEHHHGTSVIEELQYFDMINGVPIDYMHCVLLGVMKKLLVIWFVDTSLFKQSRQDKNKISERIRLMNQTVPKEFQRKLRDMNNIGHYKATELRQFLLFHGLIVLNGILPQIFYNNFVKLSVAIRILSDKNLYKNYNDVSQVLLDRFIEEFAEIYGEKEVVYNVHLLHHLPSETIIHDGPIDEFSCFPFENNMSKIKKIIHSSHCPLQQIKNRLFEEDSLQFMPTFQNQSLPNFSNSKVCHNGFIYETNESNRYVLLKDNSIFKCDSFCQDESGVIYAKGWILIGSENIFDLPLKSELLKIFGVKKYELVYKSISLNDFERKMYSINMKYCKINGDVLIKIFFPL